MSIQHVIITMDAIASNDDLDSETRELAMRVLETALELFDKKGDFVLNHI